MALPTQKEHLSGRPEQRLVSWWNRLGSFPMGNTVFNFMVGKVVPYTGSIRPNVQRLQAGFALVELKDRRRVRNHLNSIHAIALANLGEFASGLAMLAALPVSTKAIVTHLEIDYLKKARGQLLAEGRATPPQDLHQDEETIAYATIRDASNEVVAEMRVTWRLRPRHAQESG